MENKQEVIFETTCLRCEKQGLGRQKSLISKITWEQWNPKKKIAGAKKTKRRVCRGTCLNCDRNVLRLLTEEMCEKLLQKALDASRHDIIKEFEESASKILEEIKLV